MKKISWKNAALTALAVCLLSWMLPAVVADVSAADADVNGSVFTVVTTGDELERALDGGKTKIRLGADVTTTARAYHIQNDLTLDLQMYTREITKTDVYTDTILWSGLDTALIVQNGTIHADTEGSCLIWKGAGTLTLADLTMNGNVRLSSVDGKGAVTASIDRCTITRTEAVPEGRRLTGDYSAFHLLSENVHITQITDSRLEGYGYGIVSVGATIDRIENCTITGLVGPGISGDIGGEMVNCTVTDRALNAIMADEDGYIVVTTGIELENALDGGKTKIRLGADVSTTARAYHIQNDLTLDLQMYTWEITKTDVYTDTILWSGLDTALIVQNGTIHADTEGSYLIWKGAGTLTLADLSMNGKVGLSSVDKKGAVTASIDRCTITRTEAVPEGGGLTGDYSALHILSENVRISQITDSKLEGYGFGIVSVGATIDRIENCTITGLVGPGISGDIGGEMVNCTVTDRALNAIMADEDGYIVVTTGIELENALDGGQTKIRLGADVTTTARSYYIQNDLTLDLQKYTWEITGTGEYTDTILVSTSDTALAVQNGTIHADTEGSCLIWKRAGALILADLTMNGKVGLSSANEKGTVTASIDRCTITRTEAVPEGRRLTGDYSALHLLSENVHITQITDSKLEGYGFGIVSVGATIDRIENCTITGWVEDGLDNGGVIGTLSGCTVGCQADDGASFINYGNIHNMSANTLTRTAINYGAITITAPVTRSQSEGSTVFSYPDGGQVSDQVNGVTIDESENTVIALSSVKACTTAAGELTVSINIIDISQSQNVESFTILVAAYDSTGHFLTMNSVSVEGDNAEKRACEITLSGTENAASVKVFAVQSMTDAVPIARAAEQTVTP